MAKINKKSKCEINLIQPNEHTFLPGDIVRGTLKVCKKYCKKSLLILSLYGYTKVIFTVKNPTHAVKNQCKLVTEDIKIFQTYRYISTSKEQEVYKFALKIPFENEALPWSVKLPNGEVEYGIKCFLKGAYCSADFEIARKSFLLKSHVDWNTIVGVNEYYYKRACHQTSNRLGYNICYFPFSCEDVKVKVSLAEWKWYEPGEKVRFKIEFNNCQLSKFEVVGMVRLLWKWRYTNFNGSDKLIGKKFYSEPQRIWFAIYTLKNSNKHVNELTFLLPQNLMATQAESQVLLLKYKLQVSFELIEENEITIPFSGEVDILIGSKNRNSL